MKRWMIVIAVFQVAAWIPILARFLRSFRNRKNPISLAIAAGVLFIAYIGCAPHWLAIGADPEVLTEVMMVLNAIVCVFFYTTIYWADRKYTGTRNQ